MIDAEYTRACNEASDISEHVSRLRMYATKVQHVTEMGVRSGVSTRGWLHGLPSGSDLVCYDLSPLDGLVPLVSEAAAKGVDMRLICANVLHVNIEPTDILFIDTFHVYGQLKRELARHAHHAKHLIVLHDTTVDGDAGEFLRCPFAFPPTVSLETGIPEEELTKGLWPAVIEFLNENVTEWELYERRANNNGLTTLRRRTSHIVWDPTGLSTL